MSIEAGTDQQKVLEWVVDHWTTWKLARKDKEATWKDIVNAYLTHIDESKYENWPWRSKVADTFVQETGDSIASSLRSSLFPINEEYYSITGLDEVGAVYQDQMKTYMDHQLYKSKFIEKTKPFFKQEALLGNSVALLPWRKDTRIRKKRNMSGEVIDSLETKYDNFDFETLDIMDVVFDPSKIYLEQTPFIHRSEKSYVSLKDMKNVYSNLSSIETASQSSDESEGDKVKRATVFGLNYEPSKDSVELLSAYGDFEIDGKIYNDYLIVVANRDVLLRFEPNPYWGGRPITWGTYDNLWFTPYGQGPIEPILGIYHLINTFTNQKADILNLIINGCFSYVDDGIIDPENLILRPGGFIEVGQMGNIQPLQPNSNVTLAFSEIDSLRGRGERSSGASSYEKGAVPSGKRTAYEANIIKQGSASRFNDVIKHQADSVLEYTLNFYLESIKQFKFGSGEIEDEALLGEYKIKYLGADLTAVKSYETQQFMQFSEIVARNPVFSRAINPIEHLNEWRRMLNISNKRLIRTEEEMEVERQREEAAQAGGQGGQGAQGGMLQEGGSIGELQNPDMAMLREGGLIE